MGHEKWREGVIVAWPGLQREEAVHLNWWQLQSRKKFSDLFG